MPDPLTLSIRLRIYGKVQGVWFRAWTVREARRLGLDGWVRNRADGSVEAVLGGPAVQVREMVDLCRRGRTADHLWPAPSPATLPGQFTVYRHDPAFP